MPGSLTIAAILVVTNLAALKTFSPESFQAKQAENIQFLHCHSILAVAANLAFTYLPIMAIFRAGKRLGTHKRD
jgi:hypothetical protein